jgi:hypothetical protein
MPVSVSPGPDLDAMFLQLQRHPGGQRLEHFFRLPHGRFFLLIPLRVEALLEVAFPVDQRDTDYRDSQIGGRREHVARQDPRPPE